MAYSIILVYVILILVAIIDSIMYFIKYIRLKYYNLYICIIINIIN